ncbi:hypothetical protein CWC29_020590 [Pseudoalteromonas sp. S4498]|uniref:Uncharacterized protein n=1 Tax=Pseudoalteromonas galatheae TaxID=579562 RepID=A0A8T6YU84_9GAMM|nr:hypothetical protein [Pseudoalteromonas galatheae]
MLTCLELTSDFPIRLVMVLIVLFTSYFRS